VHSLQEDANRGTVFNSIRLKVTPGADIHSLIQRMADDPRINLQAETESEYYREQSTVANQVRALGMLVAGIMAFGAIFAAMNTMYASVSARTTEIGTLRALGFSRGAILASFQVEALALAAVGFVLGAACALVLSACLRLLLGGIGFGAATFTVNVITLKVSAWDLAAALVLALVIGTAGGFGPAWRAARLRPIEALRKA